MEASLAIDQVDPHEVERAAAATWPASTVRPDAGWLLRHCGVLDRKRSNSALPPAVVDDPAAAAERVERFYAGRGARPVVQVSPLEAHRELDEFLAGRGYAAIARADAMVAGTADVIASAVAREFAVRLDTGPRDGWFAAGAGAGRPVEPGLDAVRAPARFAIAFAGPIPVGVGLFALAGQWCGVYCMATAERWRRRGVAGTLLRAGARWAAEAGATRMFLQVEADNPGAVLLYERVGFARSHGYHYRVR
ncbi:GNAT family N-acetyltransferase [Saccharopolyspora erythraea]|nr:GNAT family N-acetyltransferase [Saccharopolyspora erythraea]